MQTRYYSTIASPKIGGATTIGHLHMEKRSGFGGLLILKESKFQQVDKASHKHLGYNRVGAVIDEIWEVTMINENVHDAIITVYHP
jgi:hypothetical protein